MATPLEEHAPVDDETIKLFRKASGDNWKNVMHACETFFSRLGPDQQHQIPDKFKGRFRR